MLLDILQCTGQPLIPSNYLAPNVNSDKVEKPWFRGGKTPGVGSGGGVPGKIWKRV